MTRPLPQDHGADDSSLHQLQEGLKLMRECPVCSNEYSMQHVRVIERYQGSHLVHVTCPSCSHALLAIVLVSQIGMSSVGMMTDLAPDDLPRIKARDGITSEDILDLHEILHRHGPAFADALNRAV